MSFTVPSGRSDLTLQTVDTMAPRPFSHKSGWDLLEVGGWGLGLLIIVAFAVVILFSLRQAKIRASDLISEDGKASLSRFQALLFTFVFVIALALMVVRNGSFPEVPLGVWALLAGSLATYLGSKYMQLNMAGGAAAPVASGAPLVRFSGDPALLGNVLKTVPTPVPTAGMSEFRVAAGRQDYGPSVPVAVAIGQVKMTIAGQAPTGVVLNGRVNYLKAGETAPKDAEFASETTIETKDGAVSEVRVQWRASADDTIVTTKVS
jgi:hypothetical protein